MKNNADAIIFFIIFHVNEVNALNRDLVALFRIYGKKSIKMMVAFYGFAGFLNY